MEDGTSCCRERRDRTRGCRDRQASLTALGGYSVQPLSGGPNYPNPTNLEPPSEWTLTGNLQANA